MLLISYHGTASARYGTAHHEGNPRQSFLPSCTHLAQLPTEQLMHLRDLIQVGEGTLAP